MKTRHILLVGLAVIGLHGTGWAQGSRSTNARQDDKNTMRVLGVGLGVAALDSAAHGRVGDALLLGVGAGYAGKKFEDARKAQQDEAPYGRRDRYDSREQNCDTRDYLNDRRPVLSRWERERIERREREERECRERLERERRERWERERRERLPRDRDHDFHDHHR